MGTKSGLLVGFGVGYVLGARAGRQRYQQIVDWYNRFTGNPTVQQVAEKGKEIAGEAGRKSFSVVQQGVQKASTAVKDRLGNEDEGQLPASTGL